MYKQEWDRLWEHGPCVPIETVDFLVKQSVLHNSHFISLPPSISKVQGGVRGLFFFAGFLWAFESAFLE